MYDQERGEAICQLIAAGATLKEAAKCNGTSPSRICMEALSDPRFGEIYARARQIRSELAVDDLERIKRRVLDGTLDPDRARVAADLIKWPASKLIPHKYGDRIQEDRNVTVTVNVNDPTAHLARVINAASEVQHAIEARLIPQDDQREHTRVAQVSDQAPEQADSRHRAG
jgi:hypothetical protein